MTQPTTAIADLYALQETDAALDQARASVEAAEERLADTSDIEQAREELTERETAWRTADVNQRSIELELESLREKIEPVEAKLYGGTVRNPKELADMQQDVEMLKRQRSGVEDRALEAMAVTEETAAALQEARASLQEIERTRAEENERLAGERERLLQEMAALEARREAQAGAVDRQTMRLYEALRATRQGRAVVRIERGLCQGCRISLPSNVLSRARSGSALVQCTSCERILYAA